MLARAGKRVVVVEKNPSVGGALASYRRDGYKLDLGSHLVALGDRGALGRALRLAGVEGPRFLTHPIPVRSRGRFEIAAPARRGGLVATALEAAEQLGMPLAERLRLARLFFHVLTLTEPELRAWDRRTLEELIVDHTKSAAAYFLFGFLASIFFVLPPWDVSAGEAIRALRRVLLDYHLSYVEGGMDRIVHALLGAVVGARGEIVAPSTVRAIHAPAAGPLTVELTDGDALSAPIVVFNGDPRTLPALAPALPADYAARLAALRGSGNAQQLKLALDRPLVDEGCLIGGFSASGLGLGDLSIDLMRDTVAAIAEGRISDPLVVYAPVPSNYDPSIAPPGRQLIAASIYGPSDVAPRDPPERWRDAIVAALDRAIPGLADAIVFAEVTPVASIAAWMGRPGRAAIANGQRPGEVGPDRLGVVTPIAGLLLAGDGAGGRGIGTELAAASGVEAAQVILSGAPVHVRAPSALRRSPVRGMAPS
ncbi:FAD-dependent oxidoreductase [Myxococcota bacterium]|nr:FAD-dependent oxidoreductase [Myxococcota bacterium]